MIAMHDGWVAFFIGASFGTLGGIFLGIFLGWMFFGTEEKADGQAER